MTYDIVRGLASQNYVQLYPLFKEHFQEVAADTYKDLTFDLDLEYYRHIERIGGYLGYKIMLEDKPVGYVSFFIWRHAHHRGVPFAMTDCLFMKPEHRNGAGIKAFRLALELAEATLKNEFGCQYIQFIYNVNKDLDKLVQRLGYTKSEIMNVKRL